jgi:hypothetical protein
VTNTVVAARLGEMTGREIDRRSIRFREPVRQTGTFGVPVRLYENVELDIQLVVRAEGAEDEPEVPADEAAPAEESEDSAEAADEEGTEQVQSPGS